MTDNGNFVLDVKFDASKVSTHMLLAVYVTRPIATRFLVPDP